MRRRYICEYKPPCFGGYYRCNADASVVYHGYPAYRDDPPYKTKKLFFCCKDHEQFVDKRNLPKTDIKDFMVREIMET